MTFNGKISEDELVVTGSEGTLKFSIMSNEPLKIMKPESMDEIVFEELEHVQMPLISDVAQAMAGDNELDSTGLYGLSTQEIIEVFRDSKEIRY